MSRPTTRPELNGAVEGMNPDDAELLASAMGVLRRSYRAGRHEVAAAFRLANGGIVTGLHLEASAGRSSVCAEGVALGNAVMAESAEPAIVAGVSVLRRPSGSLHLIEPCGVCAELLSDYAPDARIWVAVGEGFGPVSAAELLPAKRLRSGRPHHVHEEKESTR